ncbi:SpoIIIAC/SpoIIIAD family protein [uncultured Methanobrevibacter sp.]|uniref:SpoIIIAC/SpoIIIAD family protein n=1 Tax=uncultured Methanobrevibacter sp. TaxID=253161 RepID=UPI002600B574|nr:SpoIIIAC/SpoIIIAD family protein [uncultured Methanobrevibacter sp.]
MFLGLSIGLISLIVFGNIENLILASQGVVKAANPLKLVIASLFCVACWLIIGTVCTQQLEAYAMYIEFIGGLAIFILGLQSMYEAVKVR